MAADAFDLAERFQTPVFVVSDLDIGMNDWMCRRLTWDDARRPDRGKVLGADDLERIERFHRYVSQNGDGVAARTLPGVHPKGAFFTRGSGHNKLGGYTEDAAEYVEVVDRLARKLAAAAHEVPAPEIVSAEDADSRLGVICIGSGRGAVMEALDRLRAEGIRLDCMRIRGFPFDKRVADFVDAHDRCVVIEQNRDGQLRSLLQLELGVARDRLPSYRDYGGLPLSTEGVVAGITRHLEGVAV